VESAFFVDLEGLVSGGGEVAPRFDAREGALVLVSLAGEGRVGVLVVVVLTRFLGGMMGGLFLEKALTFELDP
jgi:hypothetical protein